MIGLCTLCTVKTRMKQTDLLEDWISFMSNRLKSGELIKFFTNLNKVFGIKSRHSLFLMLIFFNRFCLALFSYYFRLLNLFLDKFNMLWILMTILVLMFSKHRRMFHRFVTELTVINVGLL